MVFRDIRDYSNFSDDGSDIKVGLLIAGITNKYNTCSLIRLLYPLNELSNKYSFYIIDEMNVKKFREDLTQDNVNLDMIFIQRDVIDGPKFFNFEFAELLLEKCKANAIHTLFDIDDDLLHIDKTHKAYERYSKLNNLLKYLITNADWITVSTSILKNQLLTYNKNIFVVPNCLIDDWKLNSINDMEGLSSKDTVKIGYFGTSTHERDLKLIEKAIINVKNYFKDKNVIFEVIGVCKNDFDWVNRIDIPNGYLYYSDFVDWLKNVIDWDIAIAPLEENNINCSKSNLKYLEYSALSIPGVYSDIGPYKKIIDKVEGLTVENIDEEWENAIIQLIEDDDLYKNILINSRKDILENYDLKNSVFIWENVLELIHSKNIIPIGSFNPQFNSILYVIDEKLGYNKDFLTLYNRENFNCYYLVSLGTIIHFWSNNHKIHSWNLANGDEFELIYSTVLDSLKPNVIQINQFTNHSFKLIDLIKSADIPLILESNDINQIELLGEYSDKIISSIELQGTKSVKKFNDKINFINMKNILELFSKLNNSKSKVSKILVLGDLTVDYFYPSLIKRIKEHDLNNNLEFIFLGDIPPFLDDTGIKYGEFNQKNLEKVIGDVNPKFIGIFSVSEEIFNIIQFAQNKKIPILVPDDDYLKLFVEDLNGISIISSHFSDKAYKDIVHSIKADYYILLKELYLADENLNEEIAFLNKLQEDLYFEISKKILFSKNTSSLKTIDKKPVTFSNFQQFLRKSYNSPMFRAEFIEEDKRIMSVMENITDYLIENISKISKKPLVSIIMPVYNRVNVIKNAIDSILNQNYSNWELIIVDDGSTDGTRELLETFKDNRIKVFFNEINMGVSPSRNLGLEKAKGDYIAYLDSDDLWDSRFISAMLGAFIELPDADFIYSAQLLYDTYDSSPFALRFGAFNKSLLDNNNYIGINCFMYKRTIFDEIGGFNTNLNRLVDYDMLLRIKNKFNIYSVPIIVSKVFFNSAKNRISNSNINLFNAFRCIQIKNKNDNHMCIGKLNNKVSIIIPNYESLKDLQDCINAILSFNLENIEIIISDNNSNDAVRYYLKMLQQNPKFKIIFNDINFGFSYAVNQAIEISDKDSDILLLNNDAILTEGAIECMQEAAYTLPNCGMVVPQQVLPGGTPTINTHVPYAVPYFDCDTTPSDYQKNIVNMPIFHDGNVLQLDFAPFFCAYIRRDIFDKSNGIDARLGRHYRSDRIFCDFLTNVMNLKIYHVSNAKVYHKLQKATAKLKKDEKAYDVMFLKNEWEDEIAKKLGFKHPPWK